MGMMFWFAHGIVAISWVALFVRRSRGSAVARLVGAALAGLYLLLFVVSIDQAKALLADYSLAGVQTFFDFPSAALAGWIHYLVFDLWVGCWIADESDRAGMPWAATTVALLLTLAVGPIGLLVFLALRSTLNRKVAHG